MSGQNGEPDEVTKNVNVDIGANMKISSKRGTGTRDQDEVEMKLETESFAELTSAREAAVSEVQKTMKQLREMDEDGNTE